MLHFGLQQAIVCRDVEHGGVEGLPRLAQRLYFDAQLVALVGDQRVDCGLLLVGERELMGEAFECHAAEPGRRPKLAASPGVRRRVLGGDDVGDEREAEQRGCERNPACVRCKGSHAAEGA